VIISSWRSLEEYNEWVQPIHVRKSLFRSHTSSTLIEQITDLNESAGQFRHAIDELTALGYVGYTRLHEPEEDRVDSDFATAWAICSELCLLGEEILMHSRALARSDDAADFLHGRQFLDTWKESTDRAGRDRWINKFLTASHSLYAAYHNGVHSPKTFILDELDSDFPTALKRDFITAQDQFSVGLEEQGFLSTGRGLEGILRAFAAKKRILIQNKSGTRPACEASLHDLVEALSHARWRKDKSPVLHARINKLLHYIRASRNAAAHPATETLDENWKELAVVAASNANKLWKSAQQRYAGLVETKIAL